MKKNIWENVYYRLNDPVEIQLAILYSVKYADIPITDIELKHFMLQATSVDFIDLCSIITKTLDDNHMKTVWRDEMDKYILTQSGTELLEMFEDKIMASVRSSLRNTIDEYFVREQQKAQLRCDITPTDRDTYTFDVELKEGKMELLNLSVYAGSRETAMSMRRHFKRDPLGMYSKILEVLTPTEEERKAEEDA
ncbi:MAG: DUF4364 family protein [Clostridia bacterium]|nr:DUF4364 family protein [Clostridia bacterium]